MLWCYRTHMPKYTDVYVLLSLKVVLGYLQSGLSYVLIFPKYAKIVWGFPVWALPDSLYDIMTSKKELSITYVIFKCLHFELYLSVYILNNWIITDSDQFFKLQNFYFISKKVTNQNKMKLTNDTTWKSYELFYQPAFQRFFCIILYFWKIAYNLTSQNISWILLPR